MARASYTAATANVHGILEAAGYQVRGRRANCPFCSGSSKLTVAIRGELYYCHRCLRGGSVRRLAGVRGVRLQPPRTRLADRPKVAFYAWLDQKYTEMANVERELHRRARVARLALTYFPQMYEAWSALGELYDRQHQLEVFFECASDLIGRYWMYRQWRRRVYAG